jgi:hypothetical protein
VGLGHDCRSQGQAVDQRVQRQAKRQTEPTECVVAGWGGTMRVVVLVAVIVLMIARPFVVVIVKMLIDDIARIAVLMGVNVKDADQEEHREQTSQRPAGQPIDRPLLGQRVRQEVQESYAQHEPAHKTHHKLHQSMR